MSGTINLALSQQFDMDGKPLSGGLLYFYQAATSATPQDAFQDTALTIKHPNPLALDASGRIPMFYLADGSIKIRLTDKNGLTIIAADSLLVIGPSSGATTGGSGVDPNTVLAYGDIKARFGTGKIAGWSRCNGGTIGPTGSGASEDVGNQCQQLFEYLWGFPSLTVTPPRGGTAHNDWLAGNKVLSLPDLRGRTLAGLDTMGAATGALRLSSTFWGAAPDTVGNAGGNEKTTLAPANMAQHTHSGTTGDEKTKHTHLWGPTFVGDNPGAPAANVFTTTGARDPVSVGTVKSFSHRHKAGAFYAGAAGSGGGVGYLSSNNSGPGDSGDTSNTRDTSATDFGDHVHQVTVTGKTSWEDVAHQHDFQTGLGDAPVTSTPTPLATATPSMVVTFYIKL
jgi:hypothetical protein